MPEDREKKAPDEVTGGSAPEDAAQAGPEALDAAGPDAQVADDEKKAARPLKGRAAKHAPSVGIAHVRATYNNTAVTIADTRGNVLAWSSSGRAGFKGSRKSTAFAAGVVGQEAARQAVMKGMKEVEVRVQGPGAGRETAIRALQTSGLNISVIKDVTPIPHNGCRARKRRRV